MRRRAFRRVSSSVAIPARIVARSFSVSASCLCRGAWPRRIGVLLAPILAMTPTGIGHLTLKVPMRLSLPDGLWLVVRHGPVALRAVRAAEKPGTNPAEVPRERLAINAPRIAGDTGTPRETVRRTLSAPERQGRLARTGEAA